MTKTLNFVQGPTYVEGGARWVTARQFRYRVVAPEMRGGDGTVDTSQPSGAGAVTVHRWYQWHAAASPLWRGEIEAGLTREQVGS